MVGYEYRMNNVIPVYEVEERLFMYTLIGSSQIQDLRVFDLNVYKQFLR